jgi:hypothetical protein
LAQVYLFSESASAYLSRVYRLGKTTIKIDKVPDFDEIQRSDFHLMSELSPESQFADDKFILYKLAETAIDQPSEFFTR